jgi:hypothetical protein
VKASMSSIKTRKGDDSISSIVKKTAKVVATMSGAAEEKRIWYVAMDKEKDF